MAWRIGVDSGGTFTDVCLFNDARGESAIWKVSSTPDDPSRGIAQGVEEAMAKMGVAPGEISFLGHGTTVGTNTLIQLRGVKTGLITSEGFRDLLEIGRQKRPDLYDLQADKPQTLVPRHLRLEVPERLRHDGTVAVPLDEDALRNAARQLKAEEVKAVAISFLYSYLEGRHEERARHILEHELPGVFVCAAHQVAPEFREYERLSTVVVNAYLGPIMQGYIRRLHARLRELGLKVEPRLTQSNGGIISFDMAARLPVRTVLSGPSTGVVAAQVVGTAADCPDVITFDMGGTSTDVALLVQGRCNMTSAATVHGYPIRAPMLDIHTVGAGGGSIAYVDSGGLLKVGPRSAGAFPGPVCYGHGNEEATVTDANVVLQTLNPVSLLGGRMKVRRDLALAAVQKLADRLGLDLMETALGIVSVATANMAKAIRVISVQKGHDPRDYALLAFGGAGPLHAARLSRELEIKRVIVPRTPGILCATGLLMTDLRTDFMSTRLLPLEAASLPALRDAFSHLQAQSRQWFEDEQIPPAVRQVSLSVDMRYLGQNYELPVDLLAGPIGEHSLKELSEGFARAHRRQYGFVVDGDPIQLVTCRLAACGLTPKIAFTREPDAGPDASGAVIGSREVWFAESGQMVPCPVYERSRLKAGNRFEGPAIVEQMDATTLVLPGMSCHVEPSLNLVLEDQ